MCNSFGQLRPEFLRFHARLVHLARSRSPGYAPDVSLLQEAGALQFLLQRPVAAVFEATWLRLQGRARLSVTSSSCVAWVQQTRFRWVPLLPPAPPAP